MELLRSDFGVGRNCDANGNKEWDAFKFPSRYSPIRQSRISLQFCFVSCSTIKSISYLPVSCIRFVVSSSTRVVNPNILRCYGDGKRVFKL